MCKLSFEYRSKKQTGKLTLRLIHKNIDMKITTPFVSKREYWYSKTTKNGKKINKFRKVEELKATTARVKKHKSQILKFIEEIRNQFEYDFNNGTAITKEWLKKAIKEKSNIKETKEDIDELQNLLKEKKQKTKEINKKNLISENLKNIFNKYRTNNDELKKFKMTLNWISKYQQYNNEKEFKTIEFNQEFIDDWKYWGVKIMKYKITTTVAHLKRIKRAIKYSESNEEEGIVKINRNFNDLFFTTKKEQDKNNDKLVISLTFEELDKIDKFNFDKYPELKEVQKFILIGSEVGLRFNDFNKLNNENLKKTLKGIEYWSFKTNKTQKWVNIPKNEKLEKYINKYGEPKTCFKENDETYINKKMKIICSMVGINERIEMEISKAIDIDGKKQRRHIRDTHPKYMGITTRTLRRSFATNYYGQISTEHIMAVTGHTNVKSLKEYINVHDDKTIDNSFSKMNEVHKIREGDFIKKVS